MEETVVEVVKEAVQTVQLTDVIREAAAAVKGVLTEYGPEAWGLAEAVIRIDGAAELVSNAMLATVVWAVLTFAVFLVNAMVYEDFEKSKAGARASMSYTLPVFGVGTLLWSMWIIVKIFSPILWLAHTAIGKVL